MEQPTSANLVKFSDESFYENHSLSASTWVWDNTTLDNYDDNISSTLMEHPLMNTINSSSLAPKHSGVEPTSNERHMLTIIFIGITLMLLVLLTIFGNLLVCVVILKNRRLQNPTNYFILSLSLSDLSLGILVLPFSTLNSILPSWPLGPVFCNLYMATDVMLCTVSILNLFAISLDRYYAVTRPLMYVQHVTSRRVFWVCTGIWIFSLIIAFVPIHSGLNTRTGMYVQNYANPNQCLFELNAIYVLLVSVNTYFIPLIIMCAVYMKVFYIAKKQVCRIALLVFRSLKG